MKGNVENIWVVVEYVLNVVVVVNVLIEDENFVVYFRVVFLIDFDGYRNIVEEIEVYWVVNFGVVIWWLDDSKSVFYDF